MKAMRWDFGVVFLVCLLGVVAQNEQRPFIDDAQSTSEPLVSDVIPEKTLDTLQDPTAPIWSLCGNPSQHLLIPDKDGVTIEPAEPMVGSNVTVTVKGRILKRVTSGAINVDLRLMKYIKLNPTFDLCEQLAGDLFQESNTSCPLEEGPVTLIAKKYIPEDVPKVSVQGNITLTNQDDEILTCVHIDVVLKSADGQNRYWII